MNTDELILSLSDNVAPVRRGAAWRRMLIGVTAGAAVTALIMTPWLGLRPDLASATTEPFFWVKWAFTFALSLAGVVMALRLARPGTDPRAPTAVIVATAVVMAVLAAIQLARTPQNGWMAMWLGHTWSICPFLILTLAIPVFLGILWAMRSLAPTRLRIAGFAAGLASGAVSATVYALHCNESTAPFVVTWYSLGILAAGLIGAVLGPRILRW